MYKLNLFFKITVTKCPPEERQLYFTWSSAVVPPQGVCTLELSWCPNKSGGWLDTIIFEDGHRLKKDVVVAFKSISAKVYF